MSSIRILPGGDSGSDGELQRDVFGEILEGSGVLRPLLPLLQKPDLVSLSRQLHALLGEERLPIRKLEIIGKLIRPQSLSYFIFSGGRRQF